MSDESTRDHDAALVVLVPEVEAWVGRIRLAYDPSAALGVPAHITINYPFLPAAMGDTEWGQKLRDLLAEVSPFDFSFGRLARLPRMLYMPPEPEAPFRQLINEVAEQFPDSPPYGGIFREAIPHLTVADSEDESVLAAVEAELAPMLALLFPIECRADDIWLIDNTSGRWQHRSVFPLGVD